MHLHYIARQIDRCTHTHWLSEVGHIREKSRVALGSQVENYYFLRIINSQSTVRWRPVKWQSFLNSMVCNNANNWKSLMGYIHFWVQVQKKKLISKSDVTGQYCLKWSMTGICAGIAFNILDMLEAQMH